MSKKRVFTSFAMEDKTLRDFLIGQRNNNNSGIEFTDMSVKQPWDSSWKTNCRSRVKGCDGMIVIVTKNSRNADGQLWEVKCAKEEGVPLLGIWGHSSDKRTLVPLELKNIVIQDWTWANISNWVGRL
ncbi:TIR domain-containing protein [Carnobacterium maltaromaticum]|uniref:TIR domain-containing protein n=1 Tax=Carnobacterium maltaromaticum TaxID=2751 RepID=UPI0039BE8F68